MDPMALERLTKDITEAISKTEDVLEDLGEDVVLLSAGEKLAPEAVQRKVEAKIAELRIIKNRIVEVLKSPPEDERTPSPEEAEKPAPTKPIPYEIVRLMENPSPEASYLQLTRKYPEKWSEYLTRQVMTTPAELSSYSEEARLQVETDFTVWLSTHLTD